MAVLVLVWLLVAAAVATGVVLALRSVLQPVLGVLDGVL